MKIALLFPPQSSNGSHVEFSLLLNLLVNAILICYCRLQTGGNYYPEHFSNLNHKKMLPTSCPLRLIEKRW
jgi:hypothetical protein